MTPASNGGAEREVVGTPSVLRHPRLIVTALRHRALFVLGWREAHSDGRTFDGDPWSPRSMAYELGRVPTAQEYREAAL